MATEKFSAQTKKSVQTSVNIPVSTMFKWFVFYTGAMLWFALVYNPISLFFIHLFFPKLAAGMVHSRIYCSNSILVFYTNLALKWPFRWAKWWIPLDKLHEYSVAEQEIYFNEVQRSEEAMWALSPEAWALLMCNIYAYPFRTLADGLKERNDLFKALLDLTSEEDKARELIKQYMSYGTLPSAQLEILVNKVCAESKRGCHNVLFRILCDYIRRCGISKKMHLMIEYNFEVSIELKEAVDECVTAYQQKVLVKSLYNLDTIERVDAWLDFCKSTKNIHPEAQQEMSLNQYAIFLKQGHHLDAAAIAYMLWYGDKQMAEQIFSNEPNYGILDKNIEFVLSKHEYLQPLLKKVMANTKQNEQAVKGSCKM